MLDNVECAAARRQPGLTFLGQFAQMLFHDGVVTARNRAGTALQR